MTPLVSCIIPTYNRPEVVQRALRSALNQTYENKEIIVVNDGSTVKYAVGGKNVRYFKPWLKNKGGSAARNYGLTQAKGEYVVFIDDDNELHDDFLTQTVPAMSKWDAVTTGRKIVFDEHTLLAIPDQNKFPNLDWGWLIRRRVFDKIRYDENIWGDEDADLGIQFTQQGYRYFVLPQVLQTAYALKEQDATANTYPTQRRLQGLENFLAKNLKEYTDPNERRYILRLAGRNYLRAGRYFKAIRYFWLSLMAVKNWRTFKHFLFALFGWKAYNFYMEREERKVV